jgi:hypothetical protein
MGTIYNQGFNAPYPPERALFPAFARLPKGLPGRRRELRLLSAGGAAD